MRDLAGRMFAKRSSFTRNSPEGLMPALLARRVLQVIDRPEDDAGRLARGLHHVLRQGRAALLERTEADFGPLPFEPQLELRIRAIEDLECRIGDLRPDAVAGKHEDFHV